MVYDPVIEGRRHNFRVSGALYKRNLLLYDLETDSLWSQLLSEAVTGPLAGSRLSVLPVENTTWEAWKREHPDTRVLSFETGYQRDYSVDPYAAFPLSRRPALLVSAGGAIRIYPFSELKKADPRIVDEVGGHKLTIVFDRQSQSARVEKDDRGVYWFVSFFDDLKAFYPNASVYRFSKS